jgi:tetratricopeptide (TPR) repeat protein
VAAHLVGREPELRIVSAIVDDLSKGRGGLLLILGEPGIGKTRLAEAVVERTVAIGAHTTWATAWQHAGAPPLWLWEQAVRQLDGGDLLLAGATEVRPAEADAARFRQFDAVGRAVVEATERSPVVIVLDDLQWADVASLRLLAFVVEATRGHPCLLVGTCRQDELAEAELASLGRLGTSVLLGGLDERSVGEVLALAMGDPVAEEVAGAVAGRSGGNPLFVWEFGRLMNASGRTEVAEAAVPPAAGVLIRRRLARFGEPVIAVLQGGAVLGKQFSVDMLDAVLTGDGPGADVRAGLDQATSGGLLMPLSRGEYAFGHDLVRDVVMESIPSTRAATLHARAAGILSERASRDPSLHARAAAHFESAGSAEAAAPHWEEAAAWALGMLAYEEAATCFARAADCVAHDPARTTDLLLAEAEALLRSGVLQAARERYAEAAVSARRLGDPRRMAAAVQGIGAGVAGWEVPFNDARHVQLVEETLAVVPEDEPGLRSGLLAQLSVARATPDTLDESRRLAEEALDLARRAADPACEARALAAMCDAKAGPRHAVERGDMAERIIGLGGTAGDRALEVLGHRFLVVARLELGDFEAVDREIAAFERGVEYLRQPLLSWYVPIFRGMRALVRGRFAEAEAFAAQARAAAEATGSINAHLLASTLQAGIDAATGGDTPIDTFDDILDVDPAAWSSYASGVAYVALRAGDRDRAAEMLALHAGNGFARIGDDAEHLATLLMFGRTAVALGDQSSMQAMYDAFAPYAGLWVVDGIAAVCWGPVELELARLAAGLGQRESGQRHLAAARSAVDAAGAEGVRGELTVVAEALGAAPSAPDAAGAGWFLEGEFWSLSYDSTTVRLKDAKGLADLAKLISEPGREVHVLDLVGGALGTGPREGDLGEQLDPQARAAYRTRLAELEEEIDAASLDNDRGRVEQATAERDFLVAELTGALGLGGRARRTGDPAERARKAVSTRIKLAIDRVARVHPTLAAHLRNSVRTGIFCSYQPERPVSWRVQTPYGDATSNVAPQG